MKSNSARAKKFRADRRKAGLCCECGQDSNGKYYCILCKEKDKNRKKIRVQNGKCYSCGNQLDYTGKLCKHCYFRMKEARSGWSEELWYSSYDKQNGICAIRNCCRQVSDSDHNHVTGEPRELLCRRHNLGISAFERGDDTIAMIKYLIKHNVDLTAIRELLNETSND